MRIEMNGLFVHFNVSEWEEVINLKCVCGHRLIDHASPISSSNDGEHQEKFTMSQCTRCGFTPPTKEHPSGWFVCERFRVS